MYHYKFRKLADKRVACERVIRQAKEFEEKDVLEFYTDEKGYRLHKIEEGLYKLLIKRFSEDLSQWVWVLEAFFTDIDTAVYCAFGLEKDMLSDSTYEGDNQFEDMVFKPHYNQLHAKEKEIKGTDGKFIERFLLGESSVKDLKKSRVSMVVTDEEKRQLDELKELLYHVLGRRVRRMDVINYLIDNSTLLDSLKVERMGAVKKVKKK